MESEKRKRKRQTNRQRETDRHADRHADRQTDIQTGRGMARESFSCGGRQLSRGCLHPLREHWRRGASVGELANPKIKDKAPLPRLEE